MTTTGVRFAAIALVTAGLLATPARAAESEEPALEQHRRGPALTSFGTGIQVGGGLAHFNEGATSEVSGTGGYWELRAVFGTRRRLGSELAYVGSTRALTMSGGDQALVSHGVEGVLRLNVPFETAGGLLLEPFSFMGAGWSRSAATGVDGGEAHHVLTVPVGVGFAFGLDGALLSVQAAYRPVLAGGDVVRMPQAEAQLQGWSVGGRAGFEF
jgi:hypothetical protein